MSRHMTRITPSCASFISISPSHAHGGARSLACLLSRTRDHGVRWRWRWRRLMTRSMTRAMKRARDRYNCARGVTGCAIHHFNLFSPSHARGGNRSLQLAVTRAPSWRAVGRRRRRRRRQRLLMMTFAVARANDQSHYTRRVQRHRAHHSFRSLPSRARAARRHSLACSLSRTRGCGARGDGPGGGGGSGGGGGGGGLISQYAERD